ncbi:DEAD/DEAH box helicase [Saprospiraceae bacterium]|nr:DEAD/DEAH box helicase [Saprospiraceae bacterium]
MFSKDKKKSYLADEMGLGKTVQVIGFTNLINPSKILIICPASLKFNWETEFKEFSTNNYKVQIIKSNSTKIKDNADVLVVSYGTIAMGVSKYQNINFDLIVLDESHYIKNFKAKRTKAVVSLESEYKIAMTGTPILNRPAEIYSTVNWLDSLVLGNRDKFLRRHCSKMVFNSNTLMNVESWGGAHYVEEIGKKLYNSVMIRRRKTDVLKQLPPKIRQVIEVEGLKIEAQKRYKNLYEEFSKVEGLISNLQKKKKYTQGFFSQIAIDRHKTALEKVPLCAKYVINLLESRNKIIVFAHHRKVIENLKEHLQQKKIGVVNYIGGMTDNEKNIAVQKFRKDDSIKIFIGSIQAAGVGITLTEADLVLFLELDYTPGIMLQAEDRVHRIGQKKNVLIQYFVFRNGIDSMIVEMLIKKLDINNKLLGDDKKIF